MRSPPKRCWTTTVSHAYPGAPTSQACATFTDGGITSGEADGDVHRIDGATRLIPSLVQVPVPINYFEIAVYSMSPDLSPRSWTDLRELDVGIVRGQLAAERAVRGAV